VRKPSSIAIFLAIFVVALAADLVSKHVVFESMLSDPKYLAEVDTGATVDGDSRAARAQLGVFRHQVMPGVRFSLSTNPGAVFGLRMPRWLMAAATIATIGIVFYFFAVSDARAWTVHTALALILGGALGNLYDRLFSSVVVPGYEAIRYQVRDFIDCSQIGYKWIFNVADAWLVIGVALLGLHMIGESIRERRSKDEARTTKD